LQSSSNIPIVESGRPLCPLEAAGWIMPIPETDTNQSDLLRNAIIVSWGSCIGLIFGVPPAIGAYELGLPWIPYGTGVVVVGLVVGILIACTAAAFFPRNDEVPEEPQPLKTRRRLAQSKAALDRLAAAGSAKTLENRVIWRELLELELQDIDERRSRTHQTSGREGPHDPSLDDF
jgi:hypothetical protein